MKQLLLIENDRGLAQSLSDLLGRKGYSVNVADKLARAYDLLESQRYDLIIVDRLLDDGDGKEIVDYVKDTSSFTHIICLSQMNQVEDRVSLLREGADDYLGKPFSATELLLRIESLLRKQTVMSQDVLECGPIQLFPQTGQIVFPDHTKTLRRRESQILACLLRYKNQVISRDRITEYVWQGNNELPTYTTIDVYIRRLRVILGEYHSLIQTVRGFGYKISS